MRENKRYQGKILDQKSWKRDNSDRLFDIIYSEKQNNDNDLAIKLYGKKDHRYKDLKARFKDNLITSILAIDPHNQDILTPSKKYYALIREMAVVKILTIRTLHQAAIFFARRCYSKASDLGYYDIMYDAVWVLKYYSGIMLKKEAEYFKYKEALSHIKDVLDLENQAFSYYAELLLMFKKVRVNIDTCNKFAEKSYKELAPYLLTCHSSRFQMMTRLLRLMHYSAISDFESMLKYTVEDIDYFYEKYKTGSNALYIFLTQKTTACIRLGKYDKGLASIKYALTMVNERTVNWFPMKYNEYFIYMQSGKYQEAQKIYLKVINHRRYKNLVPSMKENWIIGGAYLNYIIEKGELEPHNKFKFRIGKFLNEVPEYSKDRRVKNIPILIAQIIFMIYRKQTGTVIDRMDAIKQYCGRNLRYNEAVRSNSFIMALMEIPKHSFNRIAVERHIGRFTKRLQEVPLHLSGKNFDLEIIPYERLLGYVLEDL
ncbi:MAG: hypothetical protein AAFP82_04410 [Bacteroidota bacterium]